MGQLINEIKSSFTQVPNQLIEDPTIRWSAKGVFCYLASKPTGWKFYRSDIVAHSPGGLEAVQKDLKTLEEAGYLERKHSTDPKTGRLTGYDYILKLPDKTLRRENPSAGKTAPLSNTNIFSNTNNVVPKGTTMSEQAENEGSASSCELDSSERPSESIKQQVMTLIDVLYSGRPGRGSVKPLPAYQNLLRARLKSFTIEEITQAAHALKSSPFHQGDNDRKTFYGTIKFLLRSDDQVDRFLQVYHETKPASANPGVRGDINVWNWLQQRNIVQLNGSKWEVTGEGKTKWFCETVQQAYDRAKRQVELATA